jgi:cellobiose phosphorylase
MYRLILESLLGVRREGERLHIEPCLAPERTGFRLRYRHGRSMYRIEVVRGTALGSPTRLAVDGVEQPDGKTIRLVDDGREHAVELRLAA